MERDQDIADRLLNDGPLDARERLGFGIGVIKAHLEWGVESSEWLPDLNQAIKLATKSLREITSDPQFSATERSQVASLVLSEIDWRIMAYSGDEMRGLLRQTILTLSSHWQLVAAQEHQVSMAYPN